MRFMLQLRVMCTVWLGLIMSMGASSWDDAALYVVAITFSVTGLQARCPVFCVVLCPGALWCTHALTVRVEPALPWMQSQLCMRAAACI